MKYWKDIFRLALVLSMPCVNAMEEKDSTDPQDLTCLPRYVQELWKLKNTPSVDVSFNADFSNGKKNNSQDYFKIKDEGAKVLASNTTWKHLKTLNLSNNDITNKGAESLAQNKIWTELEYLDLRDNPIGDQGKQALQSNPIWKNTTIDF